VRPAGTISVRPKIVPPRITGVTCGINELRFTLYASFGFGPTILSNQFQILGIVFFDDAHFDVARTASMSAGVGYFPSTSAHST